VSPVIYERESSSVKFAYGSLLLSSVVCCSLRFTSGTRIPPRKGMNRGARLYLLCYSCSQVRQNFVGIEVKTKVLLLGHLLCYSYSQIRQKSFRNIGKKNWEKIH
jgi:hypothetical protein